MPHPVSQHCLWLSSLLEAVVAFVGHVVVGLVGDEPGVLRMLWLRAFDLPLRRDRRQDDEQELADKTPHGFCVDSAQTRDIRWKALA